MAKKSPSPPSATAKPHLALVAIGDLATVDTSTRPRDGAPSTPVPTGAHTFGPDGLGERTS